MSPTGTIDGADYDANLAKEEVSLWQSWKAAGVKAIPTVSAGRDARPRSEYPMPWGPKYWSPEYVKDPTMAQLEAHVTDGLDFVANNPETAEASSARAPSSLPRVVVNVGFSLLVY